MTPIQKLHAIREMYAVIKKHLVDGANDYGARTDLEAFHDLTPEGRIPGADPLKCIGPRYDRMLKIYNGLISDISVYVKERREERAKAGASLMDMLTVRSK